MKRRLFITFLFVLVLFGIVLGRTPANLARAGADFVVNTAADLPDVSPGDGRCEATVGVDDCTLRAAIMESNATAGQDTIAFADLPGSPDIFTLVQFGIDDVAQVGDLDITESLTILGIDRSETIVEAGPALVDRVFHVLTADDVSFERLTIRHGNIAGRGFLPNPSKRFSSEWGETLLPQSGIRQLFIDLS